ncbi:MAG: R.Pab1 family restriction endonuclease [Patescibacteria group bacterium]
MEDLSLNYKNEKIVSDLKKFILGTNIKSRKDFKTEIVQIFKKNNETIIVKEHKNGKIYVSYELSDLFKIALQNKLIAKKEIEGLINFNSKNELDIERQYKIIRTATNKKILDKFEFFEEKAPLFINRISDNTFVEIILQHKQRAVGYQSMVYFCSKAKNLFDKNNRPIIGRTAESNEVIYLPIGKDDLIGIAESFIVASSDHAWDMKTILKDIIEQ